MRKRKEKKERTAFAGSTGILSPYYKEKRLGQAPATGIQDRVSAAAHLMRLQIFSSYYFDKEEMVLPIDEAINYITEAVKAYYDPDLCDKIKNTLQPLLNLDLKPKVEINFFDEEETYDNCTVQVLTNSVTGDISVGWWKNE